ncbi:hypothetical protein IEE_02421 [Bacillus cereus BAG5X1-1]|uniref:Uncharacterized protein n=1 Tax=Bacillus cereus BAG5X1-1 TaxID=1053189 RepID=J8A957_BACCE|nr:hypothetical protein IEE_02421 [Bacillus cereus BAG5X1-1]
MQKNFFTSAKKFVRKYARFQLFCRFNKMKQELNVWNGIYYGSFMFFVLEREDKYEKTSLFTCSSFKY